MADPRSQGDQGHQEGREAMSQRAELNINTSRVEYHPASKMYFPKGEDNVQCRLCGWVQSNSNKNCEHCNSSRLEAVSVRTRLDFPEKKAVEHFGPRKGMVCWNEQQDAESGQFEGHDLLEAARLVINIGYEEAHQEHYCKTCGFVYSWTDGRAVTSQELADAKAGKLPLKQRNPAMIARVAG